MIHIVDKHWASSEGVQDVAVQINAGGCLVMGPLFAVGSVRFLPVVSSFLEGPCSATALPDVSTEWSLLGVHAA